jgi:hypothetical protein
MQNIVWKFFHIPMFGLMTSWFMYMELEFKQNLHQWKMKAQRIISKKNQQFN